MKIAAKILAATGAFVLLLTATAVSFCGVPSYLRAKKDIADEGPDRSPGPWKFTDKGTVSDGKLLKLNGVSLCVPKELEQKPEREWVYVTKPDEHALSYSVACPAPDDTGEFTLGDLSFLTEKRVENYLRSVGQKMPHSWCDLFQLLYTLKPADSDRQGSANAHILDLLEQIGAETLPFGREHYLVNTPTAAGIADIVPPDDETGNYQIYLNLYRRSDKNCNNFIIITAPDLDSACQIANSVKLVPYQASELIREPELHTLTRKKQPVIDTLLKRAGLCGAAI